MPGPAFRDWTRALGAPEDPAATDASSSWSLISLWKAIYGQLAGGGLQAALVSSLAGTSATSKLIGTGSQTFTTQAGKSWQPGQWLNIASAAGSTNFLNGPVTSYSGTTLIVAVDNVGGSGTFADWVISLSGTQGANGSNGTAATIAVGTVSTLAAGSPATVTNVGTSAAAVFDIAIPQGAPGAGSGDVAGPASSTDNAVARFDLATGKLLQNSVVTIADTTGLIAGSRFANTGLKIEDTNASHLLTIAAGSNITADRTLTFTTGDANRTISVAGDITTAGALTTSGAFAVTFTLTNTTTVTLPVTGTLATLAGSETFTNKDISNNNNTYRQATTTLLGAAELSTDAEAIALASTTTTLTPSNLAAVLAVDVQTFTSSGTWTKPATGRIAVIQIIGAAGGGARRSSGNGSGGGCGAYLEFWFLLSALGGTETVTIGTGGAVQSTDNTDGNSGGTTSFGSHVSMFGGRGGTQAAAGSAVSSGGSGYTSNIWAGGALAASGLLQGGSVIGTVAPYFAHPIYGTCGTGTLASNAAQTFALTSVMGPGGGAGHSTTGPASGVANTSTLAGSGGAGNGAGAGGNGASPGGGGGSGTTQGGSGGNGRIIVTVF